MTSNQTKHVFRADKFVVPAAARQEFLDKVRFTHNLLKEQPGFIRDVLLEQSGGPGRFNFVTVAEWESQSAIEAARQVIVAAHAQHGIDPHALFARLGIEADLANYTAIDH